jgi:hypothetical protein
MVSVALTEYVRHAANVWLANHALQQVVAELVAGTALLRADFCPACEPLVA